ncbi:hypothetical protein [Luteimonas suaedae]|uniref:hypothetical protein n=1 Tax=Luteimonas suaedae TaxID=2605430 RepID=UPI0011EDEB5B|nr:hypothetical protein [Luteimonas suaedae]
MKNITVVLFAAWIFTGPLHAEDGLYPATEGFEAKAVSCTTGSWSAYPGGYIASKRCDGKNVAGVGTALTAAQANAVEFGEVGALGGRYCNYPAISPKAGGYLVTFSCQPQLSREISGLGQTLTDAGINAAGFGEVNALGGRSCKLYDSDVKDFPGGFVATFQCAGSVHLPISGVGANLTDAGKNALGFARVEAEGGHRCTSYTSYVEYFPGGYLIKFSCPGATRVNVSGVGTTSSDAAANALDFAMYEAMGGRECEAYSSGVKIVAGGYEVRFSCGSGTVTGYGSTATKAGQDAFVKALANWPIN